jgi:hypothetical protein
MAKKTESQGFIVSELVELLSRSPKNLPKIPFPVYAENYEEGIACVVEALGYDELGNCQLTLTERAISPSTGFIVQALGKIPGIGLTFSQAEASDTTQPEEAPAPPPEEPPPPEATGSYPGQLRELPVGQKEEMAIKHIVGPGEDDMVEITTAWESLRCQLTDAEIVEFARSAAQANQKLGSLEEELKAIKTEYKSQMERAQADLNHFSHMVSTGYETRRVGTIIAKDYRTNMITVRREDTGEIVRSRAMNSEERQRGLDLPPVEPPPVVPEEAPPPEEGPTPQPPADDAQMAEEKARKAAEGHPGTQGPGDF